MLRNRICSADGCPNQAGRNGRCPDHPKRGGRRSPSSYATGSPAYKRNRLRALRRDGWKCVYCGAPALVADHVRPVSQGGTDDLENLVAACVACNARKGGR